MRVICQLNEREDYFGVVMMVSLKKLQEGRRSEMRQIVKLMEMVGVEKLQDRKMPDLTGVAVVKKLAEVMSSGNERQTFVERVVIGCDNL